MKMSWTVLKLQGGHDFVLETAPYKVQKGITKKIHNQELWFLHSACHHKVLNICTKFHEDNLKGFKVIQRARFCLRKCYLQSSRGHSSKQTYPRVAHCPMLVNIYMKFQKDILNGFKVIEQTRFCHRNCNLQSSKGHNSNNIYPRVMVLALYTSSNVG